MGWEVLMNDSFQYRYCFMCNTGDEPFGGVFYLSECSSIEMFYEVWRELNLTDPRRMTDDERWEAIQAMKLHILGEEE